MKVDLEKLIKKHGGKWVALNEGLDQVVASDRVAKTVFNKAKKKGLKIPYLFKVPTRSIGYIG